MSRMQGEFKNFVGGKFGFNGLLGREAPPKEGQINRNLKKVTCCRIISDRSVLSHILR